MIDGFEKCIFCGGWDLIVRYNEIDRDEDTVWAPVHCNGCHADYCKNYHIKPEEVNV